MKQALLNLGDKLTREELDEFEETFKMFIIDDQQSDKEFVSMNGFCFL